MDAILTTDQRRYREMEDASGRLLNAITLAQLGRDPRTPRDLIWNGASFAGRQHYDLQAKPEPIPTRRNPCARCGVRNDHHANHGCGTYLVGGFGA